MLKSSFAPSIIGLFIYLGLKLINQPTFEHASNVRNNSLTTETVIEPSNPSCTENCLNGYLWASKHAVNDQALCDKAPAEFKEGCVELVLDAAMDQIESYP